MNLPSQLRVQLSECCRIWRLWEDEGCHGAAGDCLATRIRLTFSYKATRTNPDCS